MSTSQYLLGVGELVVIAATLGLGAFYVRELLVPGWRARWRGSPSSSSGSRR